MFVVTRDPRPIGSEVAFDLKLADGFRLFHGHGEVAWVRLHDGGREQPPGMALRFVALDERGRELVLKVLEEQVKAGGLPFEVDPPPADAILEFGGAPPAAAPAFGQRPLPLEGDFGEEPTLVGRRRSLDETGFDAPWGQKLPEVPTDLLDENDPGPSVPSVSEVKFAPLSPPSPAPPRAPAAPAAPAGQSGLFAAAFPGRSGAESPADLGFVMDENPPASTGFALAGAAPAFGAGRPAFAEDTLSPDEDPLVDFEPLAGEAPYEPDPAEFELPSFDSEEPTMIGSARAAEAPAWGGSGSRMPEAGIFAFEVPDGAVPAGAAQDSAAPAALPAHEPWSPSAAPAWDAPAAPAAVSPGKPSLFDSWQTPAAAPADPFAAPADPFAAPARLLVPVEADPFSTADADAYLSPGRAAAPPPEPYQPFDLGRSSNDLYDAAEGFGLGSPAAPPAGAYPQAYPAPQAYGSPEQPAYPGQAPPVLPAGYFDGAAGNSGGTANDDLYAPEGEAWTEEEEAPGRAARLKAALLSRKAMLGLAATALLVTGAYFLAGNFLGSRDDAPGAMGPAPETRPAGPRERPAGPAGAPLPGPAAGAEADPNAPERIVAQPDPAAPPDGGALAAPLGERASAEPATRPAETPAEPAPAPVAARDLTRGEPAPSALAPLRAASARWLERIDVRQNGQQTVVELLFDGELDSSSFRHDRLEYGKRDREMITFAGVEGSRSANRTVSSPALTAVNCGAHADGLHVVFVRPVGARISNITPEGKRVRIVLDR